MATRDKEEAAEDATRRARAQDFPAILGKIEAGTLGLPDHPRRALGRRDASARPVRSTGGGDGRR